MAVTSIRIANAASGNRIQTIEAVELDESGFSTVMERVVSGSAKLPTTLGTATRGSDSNITTADPLDLTSLPSDLVNNLITVGDGCLLVVIVEMTAANGSVAITPIMFDSQEVPVVIAPLESKYFTCTYEFRRGSIEGMYLPYAQFWDTKGAYKIGLHVSELSLNNECKVYGFVI